MKRFLSWAWNRPDESLICLACVLVVAYLFIRYYQPEGP